MSIIAYALIKAVSDIGATIKPVPVRDIGTIGKVQDPSGPIVDLTQSNTPHQGALDIKS